MYKITSRGSFLFLIHFFETSPTCLNILRIRKIYGFISLVQISYFLLIFLLSSYFLLIFFLSSYILLIILLSSYISYLFSYYPHISCSQTEQVFLDNDFAYDLFEHDQEDIITVEAPNVGRLQSIK